MRVPRAAWAAIALAALPVVRTGELNAPTRTLRRAQSPNSFVSIQNGEFMADGKPFFHFSTTAYWLAHLSDQDITTTLTAIHATGIKVVRTWAFNDVTSAPADNTTTFFQILHPNGTATINTGPNGLQRLDKVIEEAEKLGLKIHLSLTNNWSATRPASNSSARALPPGFLSNDYGGMDAYVRAFMGANGTHDQFFTSPTLIAAFKNYLGTVVPRYANSTTVFGWELANDPRCNSTIPSSDSCESRNVTSWVSNLSTQVKNLDPNHIVSAGSGGFMCVGCAKLFPPRNAPATPSPSAQPGRKRKRNTGPLTPAKVLAIRTALLNKWKREAAAAPGAPQARSGPKIRGRWAAPAARRQLGSQGTAFNGGQGVDTEDINNIPTIDFASFQLFPDQNKYMAVDSPDTDAVTQAVDSGSAWIASNAEAANNAGIPSQLSAFGLVSLNSSAHFVPFNQSSVTVADVLTNSVKIIGATPQQQTDAYSAWIQAALMHGVSGIGQYQWGQSFTGSTSPLVTQSPLTPTMTVSQLSPDDGYASFDDGQKAVFAMAAQQQDAKNSDGQQQ